MKLDLQLPMPSVTMNTNTRSETCSCEVYSIQHCVIKIVSDLRQVGGFLLVHLFPTSIKLTSTI